MVEEEAKPLVLRQSLNINFNILQFLGWWPPENSSKTNRTIYKIYGFLLISLTYIANLITECTKMVLSLNDLEALSAASFMFMTHFAEVFKLYYFISRNSQIKDLLDRLQGDTFKPRNKFQHDTIVKHMRNSRRFYIFVLGSCVFCVIFMALYPILDTMGTSQPLYLPMSMWYPFDTSKSPAFECVYLYQFGAIMINACTVISTDGTFSSFMGHICAQLDNLNDSMENIRVYTEEDRVKGATKWRNAGANELVDDGLQKELDKNLVKCVQHHRDIVKYSRDLSEQYTFSILAQFICGVVILCISLLQLTLVKPNSLQFYFMIIYELCILIEIMMFCYYSNEIIIKSEKVPLSAYKSDWIYCSISYKKKLLYFMHCTQKPIKLYAGNFFVLSFETYVTILRSSWSYFAVLHKVHEK